VSRYDAVERREFTAGERGSPENVAAQRPPAASTILRP
jgi:hypothetical protein